MTEPKFMTPAHRRAYLTHLNRCKAMDSYHRALIYILTAVPALRNNIDACFNFEKDEIKPESLAAGWQTNGTTKLTRFAYNLWNGYDDKSCTPYDLFDCSFAPYMLNAGKIKAFRIGRSYRIPKVNVIRFLQNETPEDCNTVNATIDSVE